MKTIIDNNYIKKMSKTVLSKEIIIFDRNYY
jgi:hypothetical protein